MVVVSHLSLFLEDKFRGRCDSCESHLPLIKTIYFPTAPIFFSVLRQDQFRGSADPRVIPQLRKRERNILVGEEGLLPEILLNVS